MSGYQQEYRRKNRTEINKKARIKGKNKEKKRQSLSLTNGAIKRWDEFNHNPKSIIYTSILAGS